jgi:hypothetical protein
VKRPVLIIIFGLLVSLLGTAQAPRATPPGFPTIGLLEQHMSNIGNFYKISALTDEYVRYYFNVIPVSNDKDHGEITVYFLEEYTEAGRQWLVDAYAKAGRDISRLTTLKYIYYPITFVYVDPWGNALEDPFAYEWVIRSTGEICDSNRKIIASFDGTSEFQKINIHSHMHYALLASELKNRFNLK